jgi:hypothetical protein
MNVSSKSPLFIEALLCTKSTYKGDKMVVTITDSRSCNIIIQLRNYKGFTDGMCF